VTPENAKTYRKQHAGVSNERNRLSTTIIRIVLSNAFAMIRDHLPWNYRSTTRRRRIPLLEMRHFPVIPDLAIRSVCMFPTYYSSFCTSRSTLPKDVRLSCSGVVQQLHLSKFPHCLML